MGGFLFAVQFFYIQFKKPADKRCLIQGVFHQAAVKSAAFQDFFPGRLEADTFDQFPISKIEVGFGSLAALFQEVAKLFHEIPDGPIWLEPQAIGRIADDNRVFQGGQMLECPH